MNKNRNLLGWCVALLLVLLMAVFHRLLLPGQVLFSNDIPVGVLAAHYLDMPGAITGSWQDLNWIGIEMPAVGLSLAAVLSSLLSPEWFSKLYGPLSLMFVGVAFCIFLKRAGLRTEACLLGALGAVFSTALFSSTCWGVMGFVLTWGWCFLALALLWPWTGPKLWLRTILAGFCVGMAIMDGIDVAALFSLIIAAVVMYGEWIQSGPVSRRLLLGIGRTAVVAICAALISAQALSSMIGTQVEGVGVLRDQTESKAEKWNWSTQWSLPKIETLGLAVPGLFGYRMDTEGGGNYWGSLGRDPRLDDWYDAGRKGPPPGSMLRFSGGGNYAGALVLLGALWAFHRSLRSRNDGLVPQGRRWVWFWVGVAGVTLLLAWGRFAPFYQLVFSLPGVSSIRNPVKFGHITSFALVILFAYGMDGLLRLNQEALSDARDKATGSFAHWWNRIRSVDGRFALLLITALGVMALSCLVYASSKPALEKYLVSVQFDSGTAESISRFSIAQAGWGLVRYAMAAGAVLVLLSGWMPRKRYRWVPVMLGAVLLVDLIPANLPWVVYVDVPKKYDANPVVELLRRSGPESRVALLPFPAPASQGMLAPLYNIEWAQHHFQANNIQSLDIVQMPRAPQDRAPFETALQPAGDAASLPVMARRWELTSTRHLLGSMQLQLPWGIVDTLQFLNDTLDPEQRRFRIAERFSIGAKAGVTQPTAYEDLTATLNTNGPYAVFEFGGALPKAGVYSRWLVETNDDTTLQSIASPGFHPHQVVLVAQNIGAVTPEAPTNTVAPAEFVSYRPTDIVLRANAEVPSVLLLNDRYDPDWTVAVDGQPAELLRCNYIMRGVRLEPGEHTIEFTLRPRLTGLWISLATMVVAVLLLGVLLVTGRNKTPQPTSVEAKAPSGGREKSRKA